MIRRSLLALAPFVFFACAGGPSASNGPGAATVPQVAGAWTGGVTVEGQTVPGTLTLTQDGATLSASFSAPAFGLTAEGGGTIASDGAVEIQLNYDMQCPGTATMRGTLNEAGNTISGTVQASDCTGQMLGAFDFTR